MVAGLEIVRIASRKLTILVRGVTLILDSPPR